MLEVLFFFNVIMIPHPLLKNIPKFYTECLKEWEIYQQKQISASSHILDQIIWNNKFIKIGGRSLYRCALVNKGIVRIKDILDTESKLHKWNVLKDSHITQAEYFILMSIYDALPLGWKMLLKEGRERNGQTAKFMHQSIPAVPILPPTMKRQCCKVKECGMVKCPGVIGWKANAPGMGSAGKCPTIARGGWALLELTDELLSPPRLKHCIGQRIPVQIRIIYTTRFYIT